MAIVTNRARARRSSGGHRPMRTATALAYGLLLAAPARAQEEAAEAVGTAVGGIIGLLILIVIGAVVGWLASLIVKGGGSGFWMNVLIGIGGSLLAGYVLPLLGVPLGGMVGSFLAALIGAVILILITRLIRKAAA
ncbi:MAG: GlsB/YeaQ/YmgE family stress response membrane protein [Paracoccaceae bacterium]|jgi:uncharacterized membrane protein YeaQ/YmgE (transglycosylase-associated protein family)|nr:GlsB/YeaQ/YmgE family stress response membrane protein [Paracoccaceae bacterium]